MTHQRFQKQSEVDLLTAEIGKLNRQIEPLLGKRARLLRRLNDLQAYTSVLPLETLALIFEYACALPPTIHDDDPHFPVVLGGVSTHWREVAWSTPPLWTALAITLTSAHVAPIAAISLLRLYLENAGRHCLSVRVHISDEVDDEDDAGPSCGPESGQVPIAELFHLMLRSPERIKEMFCDYFCFRWWSLVSAAINDTTVFHNLEYLHLGIPLDAPETPAIEGEIEDSSESLLTRRAPRLHHVSLLAGIPPMPLPLKQVTTLSLESIPIDKCMGLLKHCPSLTDYHCRRPLEASGSERPLQSSLNLKHVECFGWTFGFSEWDLALFNHVQLPAVERFKCENQHMDSTCDEVVSFAELIAAQKRFFSIQSSLADFERSSAHARNTSACCLPETLPSSIEDLHFLDVNEVEGEEVCRLLTLKENSQENILPRLSMLTIIGTFTNNLQSAMSQGYFMEMINSRREGPEEKWKNYTRLGCVYLGCKRNEGPGELRTHDLSVDQEAELQAFVNSGLRIVTADSEGTATIWQPKGGAL